MTKKFIILSISALIVGILLILWTLGWFLDKQYKVAEGLAEAKFPYAEYSVEKLKEMFPDYIDRSNITNTQTPEQTHRLFVENLKAGQIDEAVECCFRKGEWDEMKEGLNKIKNDNKLIGMINDLDTEIMLNVDLGNKKTYDYYVIENGLNMTIPITFIKSSDGQWLIESL